MDSNTEGWFDSLNEAGRPISNDVATSALSNAELVSTAPAEYPPSDLALSTGLPFPTIRDTTEGVAAFSDIILPQGALLVDIGAGKYDHVKKYLETQYKGLKCIPVDPYNRTIEHNEASRCFVEGKGGADVVTSMSVLNVLATQKLVSDHIKLVHRVLRPGGIAYFKVWAGMWPERGTGVAHVDNERGVYQSNRWACAYRESVVAVFGADNVFVDAERHLIVCSKNT